MNFDAIRAMIGAGKATPLAPLRFEVRRDEEAGVWYAVSCCDLGIVTEARTLPALRERLHTLVPDFLDLEGDCEIELEICEGDPPGATA